MGFQKHSKYFFWDNSFNLIDIKLGDDFYDLMQNGIVLRSEEDDRYIYHKDKHIWIYETDGKISSIYCTQGSGNHLLGIDTERFGYKEMQTIIKELSERLIEIKDISNSKEFKEYKSNKDIVVVLFKDCILTNLLITRKSL